MNPLWRIRLLRVLVPVLVVTFLVVVFRELRSRPPTAPPAAETQRGTSAEGISFRDLEGALELFKLKARRVTEPEAGGQTVEGVERLEIARRNAPPLIVKADRGDIRGSAPNRVVVVEGGIEVRDENADVELHIPALEVVEAERVARSRGEVTLFAPGWGGRAQGVEYPLDGGSTVLTSVEITGPEGRKLTAGTLRKSPEVDVVEGDGGLRAEQGASWIAAPRGTLERGTGSFVRRLDLRDGVSGAFSQPGDARSGSELSGSSLDLLWDEIGELRSATLSGSAVLQRSPDSLRAGRISATRSDEDPARWDFSAERQVVVRGALQGAANTLTADRIRGWTTRDGNRVEAVAEGSVRFEGPQRLAIADRADLIRADGLSTVVLNALGETKARIADAERRVAAERITVVEPRGFLLAEGQVETTLLPGTSGGNDEALALFEGGEAVHFVSRTFEARSEGAELVFTGGARGWQGERSLAASTIHAFRDSREVRAIGGVTTRVPISPTEAGAPPEYVEIAAAEMTYRDSERTATYTGSVRVRQVDGMMEAERLDVVLEQDEGKVRVVRAEGDVRVEYRHAPAAGEAIRAVGRSDRAEYVPAERAVRLFGDRRPASVERLGRGGVVTRGKVLLYRLESGAVEVEAGDANRATIKTSAP